MSGGKKGLCPACGMTERLRPVLSRKDGFVMNNVCAKCLRQISMSAHCIRSMSVAMVLGMTLNPEGGVMKLGNRYFQFKPVEGGGNGEYWDEVEAAGVETEEQRRARRQAELDKLYPKDDKAIFWSEDVVEDWRRQ